MHQVEITISSPKIKTVSLPAPQLLNRGSYLLKVSKFQNEFMKPSFFTKYEPNIVRISAKYVPHCRAEILTIFASFFGESMTS